MNPSCYCRRVARLSFFLFIAFLAGHTSWAQQPKKALFLGNSYTNFNNLPNLVSQLASSLGDSLIVAKNTPGGHTFEQHSTNNNSLNLIRQENWDVVVLQEQSQKPAFEPTFVATEVYPFAGVLHDSIQSNDSCTQTLFYMTWGRENGDQANCPSYTPLCTYLGMQQRLRESYLEMATNLDEAVAPVGMAWKKTRTDHPTIDLYVADGSHPSYEGSYLAACVFYTSIFRKSVVGSGFYGSLDSTTAVTLQQVAASTVLDSLLLWGLDHGLPAADFETSISGDTVDFNNLSMDAANFYWDFGDGQTSTENHPQHVYPAPGNYDVTLVASDGCESDSFTLEIPINGQIGLDEREQEIKFRVYPNPANEGFWFTIETAESGIASMQLLDLFGRVVFTKGVTLGQSTAQWISTSKLPSGTYILVLSGDQALVRQRLVIQ